MYNISSTTSQINSDADISQTHHTQLRYFESLITISTLSMPCISQNITKITLVGTCSMKITENSRSYIWYHQNTYLVQYRT